MKTCNTCKEVKYKSEFHKSQFSVDGLQGKCAPCVKSYGNSNKDKRSLLSKARYQINKEQVNATNNAWSKSNPERRASHRHNRRVLKINNKGTYTYSDIKNILIIQQFKCVYCKSELILIGKGKYHIDHIMPLFLGGANFSENLQLLCPKCNCSKGKKHPEEYERLIGFTRVSNTDVSLLKEKPVSEL